MSFVNVDDGDLRIQYSGGWKTMADDNAYNGTLHYATEQGATATLVFTGTQAGLIGCGGDTDKWGWPSESYVIDGKTLGIQNDSTADPTTMFFNVQLFASPTLSPREHTLVVTNLNGTSPNTFFLDNFWYVPSDNSASASASAQSSNLGTVASSTTSLNSSDATLSLTATSAPVASASVSAGSVSSTSSHTPNIGAIVGGAVGGAVAAVLLVALGFYYFISRRLARASREPHGDAIKEDVFTSPSSGGHVPSLSMRGAPASTLSSAPLLATREGYMGSLSGSAVASSPSLSPGYGPESPNPLLTPGTASSAPYGTSSLYSNAQPMSFATGYQDAATVGATHHQPLLVHKLDSDASPPPYSQ